ncbi:hypothetical protein [Nocardiopsis sp. MG754419]|uniref:hypothetical protein n=1 Tax=Nocardiopsis sp. MG754419 TaxID=2259865 RepID=UPI001BABB69C|nr:hypothetical protein [Nocardiopsis sp. MG754419]MBR8740385.1 hypothetical protein [Nocardiopsis sp. MG754419]
MTTHPSAPGPGRGDAGPDRSPPPPRRRPLLSLGLLGAVVALALGGSYVWSEYTHDDRAALPEDCAALLPEDPAAHLPGVESIALRGGLAETDEEGVLQVAHCEAADDVDGGPAHFSLQVVLYDPDDRDGVRRMQAMVAEGQSAREDDDFEMEYAEPPMRAVEWRSLSVGDGGYATASRPVAEDAPDELWASLEYSFANVRVSLFHRTEGPADPEEALDGLEALAVGVTERVPDPAG